MTDTVSLVGLPARARPGRPVASVLEKPVLLSALSGLTQSSLWLLLTLHLMRSSYPVLECGPEARGEASGRSACGPKTAVQCWGPGAGLVSPP